MPEKLDRCVQHLINDPNFKPKKGRDKKSAAWAVCRAKLKMSLGEISVQEYFKVLMENVE